MQAVGGGDYCFKHNYSILNEGNLCPECCRDQDIRTMDEFCEDCGQNLTKLGQYRALDHYKPGTRDICLPPLTPEQEAELDKIIEPMAKELSRKMNETIDLLIQYPRIAKAILGYY